jgi:DNA repair exonuclease SbcCD nuclease subunit
MTDPRPIRLAHLADTHLGYRALGRADPATGRNQRAVDVERAFEAAVDEVLARGVDLVVHAGDVFHHTRPSWSSLRCFVRQLRRVEAAGLPCVVIAGNHDTPRLRTTGSVFGLLELALPEVRFVAGYEVGEVRFEALNLTLHAVPHGALTNPDPPLVWPEAGRRNVLVTHGLAPGIKLRGRHEPGEETLSGALLDAQYDYVALGHYHIGGAQGNNAWYSGSTERMGWGDEEVKPGFLTVALGEPGAPPAVEHVPLPARPMRTLHPIAGDGLGARELADVVLDRLTALAAPEAMVRVELLQTPRPVRREAEAILRREAGELVWSLQVYSPADVLAGFERGEGDPTLPDLRALFAAFVEEQTTQGAYDAGFAAAFGARGDKALADAMRAAEAAVAEDPGA